MLRRARTILVCVLLLSNGAWAADRGADKEGQAVRTTILKAMAHWSALEADACAAYYTPSDTAVFFDFTPMQYVGWETYKNEIKKVQDTIQEFNIKLNDDLSVRVLGKLAYAHATWKMDFVFKDGRRRHLEGRLTEVLEKQKGTWRIVHEHVSVPTPE
jgi:ketosteroid isomerase-like protein